MPDLQHYSQQAMQDLSNAFPQTPKLDHSNLDRFLQVASHLRPPPIPPYPPLGPALPLTRCA